MSIYTKFQAVYKRLQMIEETLGDLDPVTEIVNLEARIGALEERQDVFSEFCRENWALQLDDLSKNRVFNQADLNAAVKAERERCREIVRLAWYASSISTLASGKIEEAIQAGGDGGK